VDARDAHGLVDCFAASWDGGSALGTIFLFFSLFGTRGDLTGLGGSFLTWSLLENVYSEEGAVFEPTTPSQSCLAQ
jgi:hypothetical protein